MPRHGENIRKRKDGRWEARYMKHHIPSGERRYAYLYGKTYAEVKKKKMEALANHEKQLYCPESPHKKMSDIMLLWLNNKKPFIKTTTYFHYETVINRHLIPALGHIHSQSISQSDVERYVVEKKSSGRIDGQGGLSNKTIADQVVILKQILKYASVHGWTNYKADKTYLLHHEKYLPELICESDWQSLVLFVKQPSNEKELCVLIAMHTGLRIGELCALRYADIDLDLGILSVNHTLSRVKKANQSDGRKTEVFLDTPKTENSKRKLPLASFLLPILQRFKNATGSNDAFILSGNTTPIEPRVFYRQYHTILKKSGIPKYTFHAIRHSFATRCIECGCDSKLLSELLGHSSIKITLERYVHPSMNAKRDAIEKALSFDSWSSKMVK